MEILAAFPDTSPEHDLLQRLFDEQYVVMDGKAVLRDKNAGLARPRQAGAQSALFA